MISTKQQKELAVQMWEEIKDALIENEETDIETLKKEFCKKHKLNWICYCVLCAFFKKSGSPCSLKCPLMAKAREVAPNILIGCSGNIASDYAIATNDCFGMPLYTLDMRLKAIDNIIQAIREAELEENN